MVEGRPGIGGGLAGDSAGTRGGLREGLAGGAGGTRGGLGGDSAGAVRAPWFQPQPGRDSALGGDGGAAGSSGLCPQSWGLRERSPRPPPCLRPTRAALSRSLGMVLSGCDQRCQCFS